MLLYCNRDWSVFHLVPKMECSTNSCCPSPYIFPLNLYFPQLGRIFLSVPPPPQCCEEWNMGYISERHPKQRNAATSPLNWIGLEATQFRMAQYIFPFTIGDFKWVFFREGFIENLNNNHIHICFSDFISNDSTVQMNYMVRTVQTFR